MAAKVIMPAYKVQKRRESSPDDDWQLGTGSYDAERYWNARAIASSGKAYDAVCPFGAIEDENRSADKIQRLLMRQALDRIDLEGRRVLEYGCGTGRWIDLLREYGCVWTGVDLSSEMLATARKLHPAA